MNDISFEIRTRGHRGDLECPFSGEAVDVLVKANCGVEQGSPTPMVSTGWLSVPVLEKCLKFLRACTELEDNGGSGSSDIRRDILGEVQQIRQCLQSRSLIGLQQPHVIQPPNMEHPLSCSTQQSEKVLSKAGPSQRDKVALKRFAEEIAELVNNPPTDDNPLAKSSGLSEVHIREVIQKWRTVFEDKMVMYPILVNAIGMTRERFETILKM